jgi:hypothetical protein
MTPRGTRRASINSKGTTRNVLSQRRDTRTTGRPARQRQPLPSTVTIHGKDIATRIFLESYRHDRQPARFTAAKQFVPSLTRDQTLISEVVAVLLLPVNQQVAYVDELPSFDHCDMLTNHSRYYILQSVAKYRAGGNQLPATIRVGGREFDTRRFLESFQGDKRQAPQGIAAYASVTNPSVCEVALGL